MASTEKFLKSTAEKLGEEASFRPMMGEYLVYWRGKHVGGIYDDRLLIKQSAATLGLDTAEPYPGAREMAIARGDAEALRALMEAQYSALPEKKGKK